MGMHLHNAHFLSDSLQFWEILQKKVDKFDMTTKRPKEEHN